MSVIFAYWRSGGTVLALIAVVAAAMLYIALDALMGGARKSHLALLRILVTTAPLLGLFGTVTGMIHAFRAISVDMRSITPDIAHGIATALITTQAGLVVALLGIALGRMPRR